MPKARRPTPPHIIKFKNAITNCPQEELTNARKSIPDAIRHFSKDTLRKLPVNFASINYEYRNKFIPYHGFLVSGSVNPKSPRDMGKIYWFVVDIMKVPYEVTPTIIKQANLLKIPDSLKEALQQLSGRKFATVEYFLRELMIRHAELDHTYISSIEMDINIHYPGKALRELVDLNSECNKRIGSYAPKSVVSDFPEDDLFSFWEGSTLYKKVNVSALSLIESLQEQLIYFRYLDEKLGVGKSVEESYKFDRLPELNDRKIHALTGRWVEHIEFPKNKHQANCNSASASLLQYAMNRERRQPTVTYQPLHAATMFAFAKNHRMEMHDPLLVGECVGELEKYREMRRKYGDNFWGKMFDLTGDIKAMAAKKMMYLLQQKIKLTELQENEVAALQQGRLGEIIGKYPQAREILGRWKALSLAPAHGIKKHP